MSELDTALDANSTDFPKDWRLTPLGRIARAKYGKAKPNTNSGLVPVIGSGESTAIHLNL